jgi:hypothetical protein
LVRYARANGKVAPIPAIREGNIEPLNSTLNAAVLEPAYKVLG